MLPFLNDLIVKSVLFFALIFNKNCEIIEANSLLVFYFITVPAYPSRGI